MPQIKELPKLDKAMAILELAIYSPDNSDEIKEALKLLKTHREEVLCFVNNSQPKL